MGARRAADHPYFKQDDDPTDVWSVSWTTRLRRLVPPFAVLAAGLALTTVAAYTTWRVTVEAETTALAADGEVITSLLSETMELGITQVRSIQAFFEASEEVTAVEFSRFALHQGASPGMVAIGYAPVIDPDDLQDFQSDARLQRPQYVVMNSDRRVVNRPDPDRNLVPVWYSHQHKLRPTILGVDLASDPIRRHGIDTALQSGRPALTGEVQVLGDPDRSYVEIYASIRGGSNIRPGVVFASIDVLELLTRASAEVLRGATLQVDDVTGEPAVAAAVEPDRWTSRIQLGNREWQIDLTREVTLGDRALLLLVIAGGVAISLLATVISQMIASSRRRARQMQHMIRSTRDKDVFLASVAHELRTPLTSVVGISALLADNWTNLSDREVDELLSISHAEASDLGDLIEDLLVAGRLQAGAIHYRPEAVDLLNEVRRVVSRLNTAHDIVVEIPSDVRMVHADPLRVRQIVRNIVVNGVRHAESRVVIEVHREEDECFLSIRNDGGAIAPDLVEVLFRPYQEGRDREYPGSIGLGLPVSRRLANLMGGRLEYAYADGWCTFTLVLPAAATTDDGSALAPQTNTQTTSSSAGT